eukprot:GHVS01064540.1.p1 GENE.GHVS01064540.1~~GHVS01064540.1.p1  ORF type:complete len:458 (+),score=29.01 GHVS01064540.1:79-1452(+)
MVHQNPREAEAHSNGTRLRSLMLERYATSRCCRVVHLFRIRHQVELHVQSRARTFIVSWLSSRISASTCGGKKVVLHPKQHPSGPRTPAVSLVFSQAASFIEPTSATQQLVDLFHVSLERVLSHPTSSTESSCPERQTDAPLPAAAGGVSRIIRRHDESVLASDQQIEESLADVESLRECGQKMTALARQIQHRRRPLVSGGGGEEGDKTISALLAAYGLIDTAPLSTASRADFFGDSYYVQLAKDLDVFLQKLLGETSPVTAWSVNAGKPLGGRDIDSDSLALRSCSRHGMILLHDLYCLFNRVRGTELVGPSDLMRAIGILTAVDGECPADVEAKFVSNTYVLRYFMGGRAMAIQLVDSNTKDASTDSSILRDIENAIQHKLDKMGSCANHPSADQCNLPADYRTGVSVVDVACFLGTSISLAGMQLEVAEKRGTVCRDEHMQGVFFYKNFFSMA